MSGDTIKSVEESMKAIHDIKVEDIYMHIDLDFNATFEQTLMTGTAALISFCSQNSQQNLIADSLEKLLCLYTSDRAYKEDARETMSVFADYLIGTGCVLDNDGNFFCSKITGTWEMYINENSFVSLLVSIDEDTLREMSDSVLDKEQIKNMIAGLRKMYIHLFRLTQALANVKNEYKGPALENESMKPTLRIRGIEEGKIEDERRAREEQNLRIWQSSVFYKNTCCVLTYYEAILEKILSVCARLYLLDGERDDYSGIVMFLGFTNNEVARLRKIHQSDGTIVGHQIISSIAESGLAYVLEGKHRHKGLSVYEQIDDLEKVFLAGIYTATTIPAVNALDELYHYLLLQTPYLNKDALDGIDKWVYEPDKNTLSLYKIGSTPIRRFTVACRMCTETYELARTGMSDARIKEEYGFTPADAYEIYASHEEYFLILDKALDERYGNQYYSQPQWFREFYTHVKSLKESNKNAIHSCMVLSRKSSGNSGEAASTYTSAKTESRSADRNSAKKDPLADVRKYDGMSFRELVNEMKNGSSDSRKKISSCIGKIFALGTSNDNYVVNRLEKLVICADENTSVDEIPYEKLNETYSAANRKKTFAGVLGKDISDLMEHKKTIDEFHSPRGNKIVNIIVSAAVALIAAFILFSETTAFLWEEDGAGILALIYIALGAIGGFIIDGVGGIIRGGAGFGIGYLVLGYFFDRAGFTKIILGIVALGIILYVLFASSEAPKELRVSYEKAKKVYPDKYREAEEKVTFIRQRLNDFDKYTQKSANSADVTKEISQYYSRAAEELASLRSAMDRISSDK